MNEKTKVKKPASFDVDYAELKVEQKDTPLGKKTRDTTPASNLLNSTKSEMAKDVRREKVIISVDPNKTQMWKFADRTESDEELDISDLKINMAVGMKQLTPALARKIKGENGVEYELIYGRRRRFCAITVGRLLDIELTTESDKECVKYMKIENDARKDITIMQKSRSYYMQYVIEDMYSSMREMSVHLEVPEKTLQRNIKAGAIWFNDKFSELKVSIKDIKLLDGEKISTYISSFEDNFIDFVDNIKDSNLESSEIISRLLIELSTTKKHFEKKYITSCGDLLVKSSKKIIALKIPIGLFDNSDEELLKEIKKIKTDINNN